MRKRGIGPATAATLGSLCALSLVACGGSGSAKPAADGSRSGTASSSGSATSHTGASSASPMPTSTATPTAPGSMDPASSARLSPALLTTADLPAGFHSRPLTLRNLPSLVHGCPGLEALQQTGIGDQAQGEWTRGALDAYLDEAVIEPRGDTAAGLVAKTAAALDACGTVKVVEEGLSVTLTVTPLALPPVGDASHAWHTTGKLVLPMQMNVVLVQQGGLVVLLAQTHVGGPTDDALTLQAARAAVQKAADFQKRR
jgi:hypothetical protein